PLSRNPCKSCAVVSSSGQMLGSGLGPQIDQAECVLRMNTAPTLGYETDVGSRSSLRVVSHTSVPLLLRNQTYFFQQSQDTVYVIWERSNPPVPYHYYEKGRLDECTMYMMHERASRGAHRFITEKA
ncbi:hypothetical protein XELAEV_18004125mg, partial [Xenopus laevis]